MKNNKVFTWSDDNNFFSTENKKKIKKKKKKKKKQQKKNFTEYYLSGDSYWMMGDYKTRHTSEESRFGGFVPEDMWHQGP